MGGDRITQAKDAMDAILRQMEREAGYTKPSFNWFSCRNVLHPYEALLIAVIPNVGRVTD